jgi:hypothetical protein
MKMTNETWKPVSWWATVGAILLLFCLVFSQPRLGAQEATESPTETWFGVLDVH